jgi:3-phenylpropionate/cinnamic acid dioxygenase small subunit
VIDSSNDRAEITNLLARYCLTLDHHDIAGWVSLFTPDAKYVVYGRSFEGHEGLGRMMEAAPRGLHLGGPPEIELDGDRAATRQNLLFVQADTQELRLAVYSDELVRTASDGWRIASRMCQFMGFDGALADRPPRRSEPPA